jgi:hypothetical protein
MAIEHSDGLLVGSNKAASISVEIEQLNPTFHGAVSFSHRSTGSVTNQIFELVNFSPYHRIYITKFTSQAFFDDVASATIVNYNLRKRYNVAGVGGCTQLTPVSKFSNSTSIAQAYVGSNNIVDGIDLTPTFSTLLVSGWAWRAGRATQTTTSFQSLNYTLDWTAIPDRMPTLEMAESLILNGVEILGDNIVGTVEWIEVLK